MTKLLDYCEFAGLTKHLDMAYKCEYEKEVHDFMEWIEGVLKREPPEKSIKAFFGGIFDSIDMNRKVQPCMYISGSEDYQPWNKESNWACNPEIFPNGRYAKSSVLTSFCELPDELVADRIGPEILALGFAGLLVSNGMHSLSSELTLGARKTRGLAIGFDSGDLYLLPAMRA